MFLYVCLPCVFQDQGVPKTLLEMSVHFSYSHVSMPAVWFKWAQHDNKITVSDTLLQEIPHSTETGFLESEDLEDVGFKTSNAEAPGTGVFATDSAIVAEKVKGNEYIYSGFLE